MLLVRQVQLGLAPGGHVIGIDMAAALPELLPAAEVGLVEALGAGARS